MILACIALTVGCQGSLAQVKVELNLSPFNTTTSNAEVCVTEEDSTILFFFAKKAKTVFSLPRKGEYVIEVTGADFEPLRQRVTLNNDTIVHLHLESSVALTEVVVKGRRKAKRTAAGKVFTLSEAARSCGDPFRALSEIPVLSVDVASQSVAMRDGQKPLILIDGKQVNSGIAPIDPQYIENVEVTEVVSARYLQMGVKKILNITLRKNRPHYTYVDLRARQDYAAHSGFAGPKVEIGGKKFAVSASLSGSYDRKNETQTQTSEEIDGQTKEKSGSQFSRSNMYSGRLYMKWVPFERDYLAAQVWMDNSHSHSDGQESGWKTADARDGLAASTSVKNIDKKFLAALFYEHAFENQSKLSSLAFYRHTNHDGRQRYTEFLKDVADTSSVWNNSCLQSASLSVDYESGKRSYGSVSAGAKMQYGEEQVENRLLSPTEKIGLRQWEMYYYGSYSGDWKRLYYTASVGMEYLYSKTPEAVNSYWRPRTSASLTWELADDHSLRASHYLTNSLPGMSNLVTFNQSTNPWLRQEGNPYLTPTREHEAELEYEGTLGAFNLTVSGKYNLTKDIIESRLREEGGSYVQTYQNGGSYNAKAIKAGLNYMQGGLMAYAEASYKWEKFQGTDTNGSVSLSGHVNWYFGKFSLYAFVMWSNYSYSAISRTKYENPTVAFANLSWRVSQQVNITLGMPYFFGTRRELMSLEQKGYKTQQKTSYASERFRPWLQVSWTLRKNNHLAIRNKMPLL